MKKLKAHGRETSNIFTLHGTGEDSGTHAVGFALANSRSFLAQFMKIFKDDIKISDKDIEEITIELQKRVVEQGVKKPRWGFTDIEVSIEGNFRVIIEAKRWWGIAGDDQLERYANSIAKIDGVPCLMTISQAREMKHDPIPNTSGIEIPVFHRSWEQIQNLVKDARKNQNNDERENALLEDLFVHLAHYAFYKAEDVCVVPLDPNRMTEQDCSYKQVVTEGIGYFHPIERYPEERAPDYLGFRWGSQLRLVRKVKKWTTGTEFFKEGKEGGECMWRDPEDVVHMVSYHEPKNLLKDEKPLPSGKINHRGNQWCNREMLLSGDYTFEQVVDETNKLRRKGIIEREETAKADWQKFLKENKLN